MDLRFDEETHVYSIGGKVVPSVTEICAPLTVGKYPAAGVVQSAAARGTRIHELCALYDIDALPEEFEGELVPYVQAWADFCRDYRPEWEYIEHRMAVDDPIYPYAGTADRIGVIDGRRLPVDIKTAQTLDRPAKVALCCQLVGYDNLASRNGIDMTGSGFGVQLMKNGTYRIHRMEEIEIKYGFNASILFMHLRTQYKITKGK